MVRFFAKYLLLAGLTFVTLTAQAQGAGDVTISGKVTDEVAGTPVSFATVRVLGQERGAYTNDQGAYSITCKATDTVTLEFAFINYVSQRITLKGVKAGTQLANVDVKISEKQGEVQIISAAKVSQNVNDVPISTSILSTKQVDIQASTDISAAVNQTPGVTIYDREVSIRGSSGYTYGAGSRVLTLLDGLPMISANRSSVSFDLLPTDNIAQVEIIKGASSVLYGTGAMGGVINVITAEPSTKPKTVIRVKSKFFDRPANKAADWDGLSGAISPSIHGFHARKFLFKNDLGSFDLSAQVDLIRNSGYIKGESSDRYRFLIMTKAHINILGRTVDNDGNEQRSIKGTLSFGINFQSNIDNGGAGLAWAGYPNGALQPGKGFLSLQWLQRYMIDPHISYTTANGDRHIYRGRFLYMIDNISTGQTGISYLNYHEYQFVKTLGRNRNITLIAGANYFGNYVKFQETFGTPFGHQASAFFQAELKFWKAKQDDPTKPIEYRLNVSLGGRYQFEQISGKDNFKNPGEQQRSRVTMNEPVFRAGFNLRIDEISKGSFLRASIGQALRSPSVTERFTSTAAGGLNVAPNPNIKLERGFSVEVAFRQLFQIGKNERYNVKGAFDIAGFSQQYWNIVEFVALSDSVNKGILAFNAQNISRASISGLEANLGFEARLGIVDLGLNGGLTWISPINPKGLKQLDNQDRLFSVPNTSQTNPLGAQGSQVQLANRVNLDQPYILKYRNEFLARASLSIGLKGLTLTTNWRFATQAQNYDKLFLRIGGQGPGTGFNQLADVPVFRQGRRPWFQVFDLILAYNFKAGVTHQTVSVHVFNIGNEEYLSIPGRLAEQRSFALQYKVEF